MGSFRLLLIGMNFANGLSRYLGKLPLWLRTYFTDGGASVWARSVESVICAPRFSALETNCPTTMGTCKSLCVIASATCQGHCTPALTVTTCYFIELHVLNYWKTCHIAPLEASIGCVVYVDSHPMCTLSMRSFDSR